MIERGQQFPVHEYRYRWAEGDQNHVFTAHGKDGTEIGHMACDPNGNVEWITVDPEHQRKGVATGLWNYAMSKAGERNSVGKRIPEPMHSGERTEDGEKWAQSMPRHYYEPDIVEPSWYHDDYKGSEHYA